MRLLMSALCDRAEDTPSGKLRLDGVFQDLYAPGFPASQDRMMLALVLEWGSSDEGRYDFRIDVRGPDSIVALSITGYSEVSPRPKGRPPPRTRLIMPLEDVVFPVPGRYHFDLTVKGMSLGGPTLYVILAQADDS